MTTARPAFQEGREIVIWHPKKGQRVILNYYDKSLPLQGCNAKVLFSAKGPGPRNACVEIKGVWGSDLHCIPRGNLVELKRVKP